MTHSARLSVTDRLYTFYADGIGKVLGSFTPKIPITRVESP